MTAAHGKSFETHMHEQGIPDRERRVHSMPGLACQASNAPSSSLEGWSVPSLFTSWLLPRQSHVSFSPGAGSGRPNLMVLPLVPRQMKHNPGMLERILERPSVENSLTSGGSRKASLASDLPIAEEPKARVNGSSQTLYLRSAFLDVRLQDSPTGSEVQQRSCQNMGQQASLTLWQIFT